MPRTLTFVLGIVLIATLQSGCYSFRGLTIDCNAMNTFSIKPFVNNTGNAPAPMAQNFGELLREKMLAETCLTSVTNGGDAQFTGQIVRYERTSVAPSEGQTNLVSRLTIAINIEYKNAINDKESFTKRYEWFADYDSNTDFLSVQDELINTISVQILEKLFNDAFTNW